MKEIDVDNGTCCLPDCAKAAKNRDQYCSMHRARITRHGSPDGKAKRATLTERVLAKVIKGDGCWSWDGYYSPDGYAKLRHRDGLLAVHRWMWQHVNGPVPDGLVIDHQCHNTRCINPDHLRAIRHHENIQNFTRPLRSHNTSGYRGVSLHKPSGLWHAAVKAGGVNYSGGYFKTAAEAGEKARQMRLALHTHNDLDRQAS